jgi:hypothetical protein
MTLRPPARVAVQIPAPGSDRPAWVKVGVIAAAGFAIGVAWPRLAGIRPGPSAPGEATSMASSAPAAPEAPSAGTGSGVASAASVAAGAPVAPGASSVAVAPATVPAPGGSRNFAPPAILVTRGAVLTCKTAEGAVLKGNAACGTVPSFDLLAQPRLKRLAQCPAAADASGKLSVVFNVDFVRNKINFELGRTSTIDNRDSVSQCLRSSLEKVSLNAVEHDHPLYGIFYSVTFTPRDRPEGGPIVASAGASSSGGSSGSAATPGASLARPAVDAAGDANAQVAWEVAIVRDQPRTGAVIARLQRGTKVHVGAGQDGWYRVQFGAGFASEGWLYRGAIGK